MKTGFTRYVATTGTNAQIPGLPGPVLVDAVEVINSGTTSIFVGRAKLDAAGVPVAGQQADIEVFPQDSYMLGVTDAREVIFTTGGTHNIYFVPWM